MHNYGAIIHLRSNVCKPRVVAVVISEGNITHQHQHEKWIVHDPAEKCKLYCEIIFVPLLCLLITIIHCHSFLLLFGLCTFGLCILFKSVKRKVTHEKLPNAVILKYRRGFSFSSILYFIQLMEMCSFPYFRMGQVLECWQTIPQALNNQMCWYIYE